MLFLGSKSGRSSEKMKETLLTSIQAPSGNVSFKEAKLIIECRLTQITTPDPNDFYAQEAKDYINEAYKDTSDYRKYVFGEITRIWEKIKNFPET
jgi:flavin reductase (DIM6/NTAB) family NADH-FMN oxidoreductase RutF